MELRCRCLTSPERKVWVSKYGGKAVTHAVDPPSPRHWNGPLERQAPIHMVPVPSQELPERCCIQPRTALGTPAPDFSSGLTPEAFPMSGYGRRAAEV